MTIDRSDGLPQSLIDESETNQNAFLSLSTRSRRVIAKNSHHYVHIDRPDVVEREVVDFIDRIRGNKPVHQVRCNTYVSEEPPWVVL
jgi:hypothetical protein